MLDDRVLVVSIMAVNNDVGTIQDVPDISKQFRDHGVLFDCDAAQAPCAIAGCGRMDSTGSKRLV